MEEFTQMELQNLKHLIEYSNINYQKFKNYSCQCVDPQIKQVFVKATQDALDAKQKLLNFLD